MTGVQTCALPISADHPFWAERAAPSAEDADRLAVLAAYDRIKQAARLELRLAPGVRLEECPALRERLLVLEPRLVDTATPEGVRFVDGVDVVVLTRLAARFHEPVDMFEAYLQEADVVALPSFLKALATTVARGWLLGV